MKVLALGGCGGMGRYGVRTAYQFEAIEQITVADIDLSRADAFAARFAHKVDAVAVDIKDGAQLRQLMSAYDAVLSTVGPYYAFGAIVLQAAIDTGTHYVDICDDWEPTLAMLELHEQARQAGITAFIGAGASPGISNLLACCAIAELDTVEEVYTTWGGGESSGGEGELGIADKAGEPTAAALHWMRQLTGEITAWENGEYTACKPLQRIDIDYPGIGSAECYSVGHPEPLTLPRYYPAIRKSYNLMNMPGYVIYALKTAAEKVDKEGYSLVQACRLLIDKLEKESAMGVKDVSAFMYYKVREKHRRFLPGITALARGYRHGRPVAASAHIEGAIQNNAMGALTCIPAAIVLNMLCREEITKRGVMAPEACVDAGKFFQYLAPFATFHQGYDADNYLVVASQ